MTQTFEDMQKLGKDNVDAAMKAFGSLSKSAQAIATEQVEFAKKSFESNSAHLEKLFGVKTFDKAIELNTDYAKVMYEGMVAQATKMGGMYTDFAKEAFKPVETAIAKVQAAAK
jgi:phasin family protein